MGHAPGWEAAVVDDEECVRSRRRAQGAHVARARERDCPPCVVPLMIVVPRSSCRAIRPGIGSCPYPEGSRPPPPNTYINGWARVGRADRLCRLSLLWPPPSQSPGSRREQRPADSAPDAPTRRPRPNDPRHAIVAAQPSGHRSSSLRSRPTVANCCFASPQPRCARQCAQLRAGRRARGVSVPLPHAPLVPPCARLAASSTLVKRVPATCAIPSWSLPRRGAPRYASGARFARSCRLTLLNDLPNGRAQFWAHADLHAPA
jgi:hypothetical protein